MCWRGIYCLRFSGVSCAKYIGTEQIDAAAIVGISITLVYFAHCLHPTGGATTLFAVKEFNLKASFQDATHIRASMCSQTGRKR